MAQRMRGARPWSRILYRRGAALWWLAPPTGDAVVILPEETGAVFGVLFCRANGKSMRVKAADIATETAFAWAEQGGAPLLQSYWGNYLAVLHDRACDRLHVLRDPAGSWPAFHGDASGVHCVFTDAADFISACAGAVRVDPLAIQLFLAQSRLPTARTAIEAVTEIMPGERLTLSRGACVTQAAWRPTPNRACFQLDGMATARDALRATLIDCAQAWRSVDATMAHRLSGGLDSSVALAALCAQGGGEGVICINERPRGVPEGDEAPYARLAAAQFRVRLIEVEQSAEDVDYGRVLDIVCGAKPALTELSFGSSGFVDAAQSCGAHVLTSGQGGDQVFQRGGAQYFPLDAVREGLPLRAILDRVVDAAQVSRRSAWSILTTTIRCAARSKPPAEIAIRANPFWGLELDGEIAAENARHPWAGDADQASPPRAYLIRHLADVAYYHRPSAADLAFVQAPFLASQPVIELVLKMPAYFQTMGGRDRALVRDAFDSDLPAAIAQRRTKGDTTRHFARVMQKNLPIMRELLIDGELVRSGLIDPVRLGQTLKRSTIVDTDELSALLNAFVAETWLRRFHAACLTASQ